MRNNFLESYSGNLNGHYNYRAVGGPQQHARAGGGGSRAGRHSSRVERLAVVTRGA